jgi:hypothetical protein
LNDEQLVKLQGNDPIFKHYTLFKLLKTQAQVNKWCIKEDQRDNPHSTYRDTKTAFLMQLFDSNMKLIHSCKKEAATKVQGRQSCAFEILQKVFGPEKKWMELVEETQ